MLHRRCRLWMNCVIVIPAKLCNQRQFFSHDVELNNKGILHVHVQASKRYQRRFEPGPLIESMAFYRALSFRSPLYAMGIRLPDGTCLPKCHLSKRPLKCQCSINNLSKSTGPTYGTSFLAITVANSTCP